MNDSTTRADGTKRRSWGRAAVLITALTLVGGGIATLVFSPLTPVSAQEVAETFYVGPRTTAGGTGSEASPLRWLEAINRAGSGDTIIFKPGVYNNANLGVESWDDILLEVKGKSRLTIRAQYTATLTTDPAQRSVIKPTSDKLWVLFKVDGSSYITIRGFEIDGTETGDRTPEVSGTGAWPSGFSVNGGAPHHIVVADNIVHDMCGAGIGTGGADYVTIEGNTVYNNCNWSKWENSGISMNGGVNYDNAPGFHNFIRRNRIYNNIAYYELPSKLGNNIHTDSNAIIIDVQFETGPATLIENNLCYGNGGRGVHVFRSSNVTAQNNTCYKNCQDPYTRDGELSSGKASNVLFVNNIAVPNGLIGLGKDSNGNTFTKGYTKATNTYAPIDASTIKFAYNLYFNGPATYGNYDTYGDPKFADAATGNFRLNTGSAARDTGTRNTIPGVTNSYPERDFFYNRRYLGTTVDRGATEQ